MNKFFDDLVDDFLGKGDETPAAKAPVVTAARVTNDDACHTPNTAEAYRERCGKCSGTGAWLGGNTRYARKCYACEGRGFFERKTSPQVRAQAAVRRETAKADRFEAFKAANAAVAAWIETSKGTFPFAASLREAIEKFGDLTDRQLEAAQRCVDKRKATQQAAVARVEAAPLVQVDKLFDCFAKAQASGLKHPKMRFEGFEATLAGSTSKNAGGVYLKDGGLYLGKIVGGKFIASRDANADHVKAIVDTMADPLAAAVAFGRRTGNCSICNRGLTVKESVERGIGPICAERFGL